MALEVVEKKADVSFTEANIVLAAATGKELRSREADELALLTAQQLGLSRPGMDTSAGPYPVDADGKTSDDVATGKVPKVGYRRDFRIRSAG